MNESFPITIDNPGFPPFEMMMFMVFFPLGMSLIPIIILWWLPKEIKDQRGKEDHTLEEWDNYG